MHVHVYIMYNTPLHLYVSLFYSVLPFTDFPSRFFVPLSPLYFDFFFYYKKMALSIRNRLGFHGLLHGAQHTGLMMLNFMYWDSFLSVESKWVHSSLGRQKDVNATSELTSQQVNEPTTVTFKYVLNLKQCYSHTASTFSVISLFSFLFDHIWYIVDPCVTVTFFMLVIFNKVLYLLDLFILLRDVAIQLPCPSNCEHREQQRRKMTRAESQRAVCQQQCWLCKDGGRNSTGATTVYGL